MKISDRPRIAVLKGGLSEEFPLSMQHGNEVAAILRNQGRYDVLEIAVAKNGDWLQDGFVRAPQVMLEHVDAAYIALHGVYGEDGTVQRVLDRHGVRYQGSKPYQSALALHKMRTKEAVKDLGIATAPHMRITRSGVTDSNAIAHTIGNLFGPAYILKPMRGGSSIGNQYAATALQLAKALEQMFVTYEDILVEQYIEGTDITCGVIEGLRDQAQYITPEVEIILTEGDDIFSAKKVTPGRFSKAQKTAIADASARLHTALDLRDISRSDFRLTAAGDLYFLEVNTLPAVTKNSPLMAGLNSFGVSQEELVCHLCGSLV